MLKRTALLAASALALSLSAMPAALQAQTTQPTATNLKMGGAKILTGIVTATPVNAAGNAIPFADATGSQNGPTAFACQIANGAITGMIQPDGTVSGTCLVPDSALTLPANILYTFQVSDTSTGRRTSGQSYTLPNVVGVTGATWALDHYATPAITSSTQLILQSQGATTPTTCTAPSLFTNTTNATLYQCIAGVEVAVSGGSGGSVTFGTIAGTAAQGNDSRITGAEQTTNKNAANGYLGLDSNGFATPGHAAAIISGDTSRTAGAASETVVGIQGKPVSATAPTTGQGLIFNGTNYVPTTQYAPTTATTQASSDNSTLIATDAFTQAAITANTRVAGAEQTSNKNVANGYLGLDSSGYASPGHAAAITSGDTSRTAGAASETVVGIQGKPVATTAPTTGQGLVWNGTNYVPTTPSGSGSGTVSSANAGQLAEYAANGTTVSGSTPDVVIGASPQPQTILYAPPNQVGALLGQTANTPNQPINPNLPTFEYYIGDSKPGYYALDYKIQRDAITPLNSLGGGSFNDFISPLYGTRGTTVLSGTGTCTATRNDNSSAQNFGPFSYIVTCTNGAILTYTQDYHYPFDAMYLGWQQAPSNGTFTYSVSSATPVSVNTAGTAQLGSTLVASGLAGRTNAGTNPTLQLTVTSGTVVFYSYALWQHSQPGPVVIYVSAGGSTFSQWASQPSYLAQQIAALPPSKITVDLGTNDAPLYTPAQFQTSVNTWLAGLNLSSLTVPPDVILETEYDRGTYTGSTCIADTTSNANLDAYRASLFQNQATGNYYILDFRKWFPKFTTAYAMGLYQTDCIHPSGTGQHLYAKLLTMADQLQSRDVPYSRYISAYSYQNYGVFPGTASAPTGFGVATHSGSGADGVPYTGMYFSDANHADMLVQNVLYDRFGSLGTGSGFESGMNNGSTFAFGKTIHALHPELNAPCPLYSYSYAPVHGTPNTNMAWSLCSNSTDGTWNQDWATTAPELHYSYVQKDWLGFKHSTHTLALSSDSPICWTSSASTVTGVGGGSRAACDTSLTRVSAGLAQAPSLTYSGYDSYTVGSAIASAATITPTGRIFHVTGTSAISTMNLPTGYSATVGGQVTLIADAAWTITAGSTSGQFKSSLSATAGTPYIFIFDGTLWYAK